MTTRDELFQHFGPLLLEAIELFNLEFGQLKQKVRDAYTPQQKLDRIKEIYDSLPPYSWMD